jgi:site-specific DNA-methyltransferase (adenine-specific)
VRGTNISLPRVAEDDVKVVQIFNEDALAGVARLADESVDLIVADPPYGLGKDYGNDSDHVRGVAYVEWTRKWVELYLPKLKPAGSFYIFLTWQHSPEVFSYLKTRLTMVNEIIWDRRVPSMGGSVRKFSSVHDTIGFFVKGKDYHFDLDAVRIPYDPVTKKARSRSIFVGSKWLELGYNPKDLWSISRLHREHAERVDHPTQKPLELIERIVRVSAPVNGLVVDPFAGSGTAAVAAQRNGRRFIGFELNPDYHSTALGRLDTERTAVENRTRQPELPHLEA